MLNEIKLNKSHKITFLIGLPGSGKSYWIKKHKECNVIKNNENYENNIHYLDDISQTDAKLEHLKTILKNPNQELYISDVNFLEIDLIEKAKTKIQELSLSPIEFKQILFVGDYVTCQKNVAFRNDGRLVEGTLKRFAENIPILRNKWENDVNTTMLFVQDYTTNDLKMKKLK
jgi:hypothetical protein